MKNTKKAFMGITALVIAFSACAFTACDSEPKDGSIKGNYHVATEDEIVQTLSAVDEEKLFGDTTAENYKFGLDVVTDLGMDMNANATAEQTVSMNLNLTSGYKLLISGTEENPSLKGAGNLNFNYAMAMSTPGMTANQTADLKVDTYQDNAMEYTTVSIKSQPIGEAAIDKTEKLKIDVDAVMAAIAPSIPSVPTTPETPTTPSDGTINQETQEGLAEAVKELAQAGATVSLDTKNGIKLKVSFNEDMIMSSIAEEDPETSAQIAEALTFNKCGLDIYLSIDKAGVFNAASVVMDIDLSIDPSKIPTTQADVDTTTGSMTFKMKGKVVIKTSPDVKVELPANLATDETYVDGTQTVIDAIGDMMGGITV